MPRYSVQTTAVYSDDVEVEAESKEAARALVRDGYAMGSPGILDIFHDPAPIIKVGAVEEITDEELAEVEAE